MNLYLKVPDFCSGDWNFAGPDCTTTLCLSEPRQTHLTFVRLATDSELTLKKSSSMPTVRVAPPARPGRASAVSRERVASRFMASPL